MFNRYYPLAHVKVEFAKFSTREEKNRSFGAKFANGSGTGFERTLVLPFLISAGGCRR
jgi:hypothetical protein